MTGNSRLKGAMKQLGLTQRELAKALNAHLRAAGEYDTVSERTVRTWLTGKSAWPRKAKRRALEGVFRCPVEELGFTPPASNARPKEDSSVFRRTFVTSTFGAAASPLLGSRQSTVGASDVARLRAGLDSLTALDDRRGGHSELEEAALDGARKAVELQKGSASQRIRLRLFSLAASYSAAAAWSCIDLRQLDRAQVHLNEALRLAGMAQDSTAQVQVWNATAMLAHQRRDHGGAVAAAQAAQALSATRRDPMVASLAHARTALGHSNLRDGTAALRSLRYAESALSKAHPEPRPAWLQFYGAAELHALTAIVLDRLGEHAAAEAASYRALSALPDHFRRNRALATTRLALAQLHQGEVEQGCATTEQVFALMAGAPLPARMRSLLGDFYRDLLTLAPNAATARAWGDRYRSEWSTT
ncbi:MULTISPECIES: helix-turn-helix domain-containing protein [unclassified Streptomyces]|uniref:helix-turn-helix domain-containing protein n=1 Tax=unclassified Streptomyces TaxID=2593676 RepID=UPI000CAB8437|nr:helix-turn-helix transcriptional regulator [Streptomyces sp. CB02959]PJN40716.1 hypothetical protein CG747_10240 [Streptomyces sp. CB02959]